MMPIKRTDFIFPDLFSLLWQSFSFDLIFFQVWIICKSVVSNKHSSVYLSHLLAFKAWKEQKEMFRYFVCGLSFFFCVHLGLRMCEYFLFKFRKHTKLHLCPLLSDLNVLGRVNLFAHNCSQTDAIWPSEFICGYPLFAFFDWL